MDNLDLSQLELMLYVLLGLIFVVLVALVAYVVVSVRRRNAEAAEAAAVFQDAEDLVVRPSLLVVGQILALVRDEPGGPIQVEIEGTKYGSLSEVEDPLLRRQIMDAGLQLIQFTGVLGEGAASLPPLAETDSWREDVREESKAELERAQGPQKRRPAPAPAPEEVEEQFLNLLTEMGQPSSASDKRSLTSSIQKTLAPKPPDLGQARTFVDDIDGIVQRRVSMIPALAGRNLHVRPGPGGKVLFTFEGQEYKDLDALPNLTARQVIRDAIQEWDDLN